MDIKLGQERLEAYFRTFNASDEAGHLACFHPEAAFFGSGSGSCKGVVAIRGVYQAAKQSLDLLEMHPLETYGVHPELAVRVEFRGRKKQFPAVLVFRFDEAGAILRLSILYDLRKTVTEPF
ncbi:hypothetical protein GETHLI_13100 [Geothrix limicola]|uniref:SnoaL-like domain-containing protein n=1 Tax=Geothrix limicola TaxID=2927978 RepID=A0ABQ5QEK6_9BACT|nr:nuclear transport factor 2 family protein [Geothrix limicola]GLH72808.1 hypothetical protein GETHLI_13100 [Geothrix limicola]